MGENIPSSSSLFLLGVSSRHLIIIRSRAEKSTLEITSKKLDSEQNPNANLVETVRRNSKTYKLQHRRRKKLGEHERYRESLREKKKGEEKGNNRFSSRETGWVCSFLTMSICSQRVIISVLSNVPIISPNEKVSFVRYRERREESLETYLTQGKA
jgi:hypothetical protein